MSAKLSQEQNGDTSSIRAMCFMSIIVAAGVTAVAVLSEDVGITECLPLIGMWLGIPIGAKVIQKPSESTEKKE